MKNTGPIPRLAGALLLCSAVQVAADDHDAKPAPPSGKHAFFIGGRLDDIQNGETEGGGRFDWVYTSPGGAVLNAGLAAFSVGDSRWSFAKLGGVVRPRPPLILSGEINYGSGTQKGSNFPYRLLKAGVTYEALPKRLYLELEDQYIDIDDVHGHLVKGGFSYWVRPDLALAASYAASVSGNLDTRIAAARADYYAGRNRIFAGFALGRTVPEILEGVAGTQSSVQDSQEYFVGFSVPVYRYEFTLAVSHIEFEGGSKTPVVFSFKIPW